MKFWAQVQRLSVQFVTQCVSAWSAGYVITYSALHEIRLIWIVKENER